MKQLERIMIIMLIVISSLIIKTDIQAKEANLNIFPTAVGMKGKVITTRVNLRSGPDLSSNIIGRINHADIMVTGKYKDWYRIRHNNADAWMSKQYVSVPDAAYIPEISLLGEQIVEYGKQFIGTPYVWGGTNLNSGVDCSGFTQGIYKEFDININRISYMQALNGQTISKNELRSGDLVFFDTNGINRGNISHVGVYVGGGEFIHSDMTKGISIAKLDNSYYRRNYVKSVRVPGI